MNGSKSTTMKSLALTLCTALLFQSMFSIPAFAMNEGGAPDETTIVVGGTIINGAVVDEDNDDDRGDPTRNWPIICLTAYCVLATLAAAGAGVGCG